ncbi:MAG TPA: NAD-dependent deacylase [Gemmataceae bacterium]|jgi:NAD-dependent deacetylase
MHPPTDSDDAVHRAAALLREAGRVAVLTGAGVSAESGIPTFRDADGLWEGHPVEQLATPNAFRRDPALVWKFYNARRDNLRRVEPNPGHHALARLEERRGPGRVTVVTQNVDGLHRRAGSKSVVELHGNLTRTRCTGCGRTEDRGLDPLGELPTCPHCGALVRPDVVWFTEPLPEEAWRAASRAAEECDCLLVVGTSAVVYPAAGLITAARTCGAAVVEFNVQRTAASHLADVNLFGPSGQTLPAVVDRVLGG